MGELSNKDGDMSYRGCFVADKYEGVGKYRVYLLEASQVLKLMRYSRCVHVPELVQAQ